MYRECRKGSGGPPGGPPAPGGHMGCRGCALAYVGQGHQPQEAHAPRKLGEGRVLKGEGTSPFSFILAHGPLGAGALGPCRPRRTPYSPCGPRGRWPHPVGPRDPSGGPGTIPMTPKLVPMAETGLPIYKSLPPDHSRTPRDVRDLIRDSEQHSVTAYILSL